MFKDIHSRKRESLKQPASNQQTAVSPRQATADSAGGRPT